MTQIDDLLVNAERQAQDFDPNDLTASPRRRLAILACMDARLQPYAMLGLGVGEAHLIRNAGGVVTDDVIRSLAISQRLLGSEEIMVIQHTDCGLHGADERQFKQRLEADTGRRPDWSLHAFEDLDENVRRSLSALEQSPFLSARSIRGFVYETETGRLREVQPAERPGASDPGAP